MSSVTPRHASSQGVEKPFPRTCACSRATKDKLLGYYISTTNRGSVGLALQGLTHILKLRVLSLNAPILNPPVFVGIKRHPKKAEARRGVDVIAHLTGPISMIGSTRAKGALEKNMDININDLTVGQIKEIAAVAAGFCGEKVSDSKSAKSGAEQPVIVCTDKRGVVFGYTADTDARPIVLTKARMALYWSADVGGVFGLAEKGPTRDCKISAVVPSISLEGVTAIMTVDAGSEKAWNASKVQGR